MRDPVYGASVAAATGCGLKPRRALEMGVSYLIAEILSDRVRAEGLYDLISWCVVEQQHLLKTG